MEGRVYVCSWKPIPAGYAVWVKARPAVRAEGATFEKADEALYGPILAAYGDGENVREYDPPPPVSAGFGEFLQEGLVTILGNARAPVTNLDELYEGGVCERCSAPRGARTSRTATVADIESGFDGGFTRTFYYFSEAFVALLTADERARFEWRRVDRPERARKIFLELIPRAPVPLVAVRGRDLDAVECDVCRRPHTLTFFHSHQIAGFVCEGDLERPRPSCFPVGPVHQALLALTRDRWRAMVGKPGTRGLMSYELGVVSTDLCDRDPPRRLMDAKRGR